MSHSRVAKLVREVRALTSLKEAADLRGQDIDIFLPEDMRAGLDTAAIAAVDLAIRCMSGQIRIHRPTSLMRVDASLLRAVEMYGQPTRLIFMNDGKSGPMSLSIGCKVEGAICADASGWVASVNCLLPLGPRASAPAATFAIAAAFSKLFCAHVLLNAQFCSESWSFCLRDFSGHADTACCQLESIPNLGRIGVLGAGAIGSALLYVLNRSMWEASIDLIDRQAYDEPNEETTFFLGGPEARRRRHKSISLSEAARRPGLDITPLDHEIRASSAVLDIRRDAFVSAVDNSETRCLLDTVNATLLVNAGVGGSQDDAGHVLLSRHLPGDPKLSARYRLIGGKDEDTVLHPPTEVTDECSRVAYNSVSMAAPFIGLAAGSLLASSLAHRALDRKLDANYLKFDLFRMQSYFERTCWPARNV